MCSFISIIIIIIVIIIIIIIVIIVIIMAHAPGGLRGPPQPARRRERPRRGPRDGGGPERGDVRLRAPLNSLVARIIC